MPPYFSFRVNSRINIMNPAIATPSKTNKIIYLKEDIKKRRTSITAFLLVAVLLIGSLAGCAKQNTTTVSEDGGKYLYKVSMVNAKEGMQEDELYRHVIEKFNIDFEVLAVSYDNWTEKNRIWLSSGDMPDAVKWEFIYSDYLDFVNQKVVRALPDG